MEMRKHCIECGEMHWTLLPRCPACNGVREFHRKRLSVITDCYGKSLPYSETAFETVYGARDHD